MELQKTWTPRAADLKADWYIVDAEGETLGRLASNVARLLRGKHKPTFTPHVNTGDHVIVINASKIRWSGRKGDLKIYDSYSGYPGGRSTQTLAQLHTKSPAEPIRRAVAGMLQHNTLGRDMLTRLRVYSGPNHRHQAQGPRLIRFNARGGIDVVG
jgi:large subunit ribosomal protein L13